MSHKIGWVGTGRMGYPMAGRLAKDGQNISVWNRTKAKADPLSEYGATVVEKVRFGVMISDPFLKFKDAIASRLADDPEFTISPYFFPNSLATVFSNFFTSLNSS